MRVSVENLSFSYPSSTILEELSFEIVPHEIVAILGPNGAGKTTLLRLLNKILKPDSGLISFDERSITSLSKKELSKMVGYVPQRGEVSSITVYEMILLGRIPYLSWNASAEDHRICSEVIDLLQLEHLILKPVNEISGGEFQLVQIGRSLAQQAKVLLLDEPTSNLDLQNQIKIMQMLSQITQESEMATVIAIHDLNLALRYAKKFILLKDKKLYASGGKEIITAESVKEVYQIEASVVEINGYPVVVPH